MRVVVNEAWGNDDDGVCGSDRSPGCVPTVLEEDCNPQGDHSRQSTETLKKKGDGGTSSRRDGLVRLRNGYSVFSQGLSRNWLSPSNPSTNHKIACNAHHRGTIDGDLVYCTVSKEGRLGTC